MNAILIGREAAAAHCGFATTTLDTHRKRGTFPPPAYTAANVPVWTRNDIDEWKRTRPGKAGRPPHNPLESTRRVVGNNAASDT